MRSAHLVGAVRGGCCIICDRVFVINIALALVPTHFGFSSSVIVIVHVSKACAFV